jgi:hypothetical protein
MRLWLCAIVLLSSLSALPQQPSSSAATSAGSVWEHVQALPVGTSLYISGVRRHAGCKFKSADADTLTCSHGQDILFQRAEIKAIKIPHHGRSTLVGAGIGAGVGAILGAAVGSSCTTQQRQSFLGCLNILSRGDLAVGGAVTFGVIGTPIGYFTDFTRSTVYRGP